MARLDTTRHGTAAATSSASATADNVSGLVASIPKSCDSMALRNATAPASPPINPIATSFNPCDDDEPVHVRGGGAERHAHADLALPFRNQARDDAVDAEHGDAEPGRGEHAGEPQQQAPRADRVIDDVVGGTHREDGEARIVRDSTERTVVAAAGIESVVRSASEMVRPQCCPNRS